MIDLYILSYSDPYYREDDRTIGIFTSEDEAKSHRDSYRASFAGHLNMSKEHNYDISEYPVYGDYTDLLIKTLEWVDLPD